MENFFKLLALVCLFELANCWVNIYDKPFKYSCPKYKVITTIASRHNNHHEDRQYIFACSSLSAKPEICKWTGYINNFKEIMMFVCPSGGLISGFKSYHSNHHEDRRWRVRCCRHKSHKPTNCRLTKWLNDWDKAIRYRVPKGKAINGIFSYHRNDKKDRRWRLLVCKF